MQTLRYFSATGLGLSLALLFGFISRAIPSIAALHLVIIAAIVLAFAVGAVNSAATVAYYQRRMVYSSFIIRAIAVIAAYLIVMGVGAWLYVAPEVL